MAVMSTSLVAEAVADVYIDWYARSAKQWEKRMEESTRPSTLVGWAWQCEYCQCLASHEDSYCDRCGAPPPTGVLVSQKPQYEDMWCGKQVSKDKRYKLLEEMALGDYPSGATMPDAMKLAYADTTDAASYGTFHWRI